jgi:hypothetical protein
VVEDRVSCAVVLHGGESASGLADLLHQFLEQQVADPARARRAARLRGSLLFRAAEDPAVCVRIAFSGDRIDVADDAGEAAGVPVITSDFLTTAHLTTGEEGPLRLLLSRRLRVRLPLARGPFLLRALRLMRVPAPERSGRRAAAESKGRPRRRRARLYAVLAAAMLLALLGWLLWRGG